MSAEVLQLERAAEAAHRRRIELADEPPFQLGELTVEPALREVAAADGSRQTLEPRVMQVLVALARAEGATVSRDELIRTCWNGTVVGEDSINRTISLLRRLAEGIGREAFRIETIPRVGYRLVAAHPASGTSAAPPKPLAGALAPRMRPLHWVALAVVLATVAAALAFWRAAPAGPRYSVVVEPFQLSGDLAGFDDELSSALSSRDVPMVGGGVRLQLTGSVERLDGRTRVNARLVEPGEQQVVWSGAVELPNDEPGAPARAAGLIAVVAQCTLAFANDADDPLPLAVLSRLARTCELTLAGRAEAALPAAREITESLPDFPGGWFALSQHAGAAYSRQPLQLAALRKEAEAAADRLIALRPEAQEGYSLKALAIPGEQPLERERLLRRATGLEPIYADFAPSYLAGFLLHVGRLEEAFQLTATNVRRHPEILGYHMQLFFAAAATGRMALAEQAMSRARELEPSPLLGMPWRMAVWQGDWREAERFVPIVHPAQEQAGIATYRALASGDGAAKGAAARLVRAVPADCCMELRIEMLTLLGQYDEAVGLLDGFLVGRSPGGRRGDSGLTLWDPVLRPLLYRPGMAPFLQRNGWIAYWRESGTRPDVCGEDAPPAFCRLLAGPA